MFTFLIGQENREVRARKLFQQTKRPLDSDRGLNALRMLRWNMFIDILFVTDILVGQLSLIGSSPDP